MLLIKRLAFNWACMTLIFMQNKCFSINLSALCVFAHSLLQRWMQACLCAYIIGGVCDMFAHITLGSQVLLSWVWSFSLSVVVWEQSGHTSPPPPPTLHLIPGGCQPQLEHRRSGWAMRNAPRGAVRWTRVQLGQTLLNAQGWLRSDRLGQRQDGRWGMCARVCLEARV